jgi:hypothetical protein
MLPTRASPAGDDVALGLAGLLLSLVGRLLLRCLLCVCILLWKQAVGSGAVLVQAVAPMLLQEAHLVVHQTVPGLGSSCCSSKGCIRGRLAMA